MRMACLRDIANNVKQLEIKCLPILLLKLNSTINIVRNMNKMGLAPNARTEDNVHAWHSNALIEAKLQL